MQRTVHNHWRLDLFAPGAAEPTASVWADVRPAADQPGELLLALCHPYPGVDAGPGWRAARRGRSYDVVSAGGRELIVREQGS